MSIVEFKPIAIVGMACRFPKGLSNIDALWQALRNQFSAIDTVPDSRWTADRYFSSNPISKGKAYIRRGGFLTEDIATFDASFFGITPRDAENMDPQQRLLLEVVWEAFENAGISLPASRGKRIGVYVGGFMLDHMITQMTPSNRSQINQNTAAGMMMTMLSNRISHTFDLRGPSLSIDTACSSSLVAFHYGCQDLWRGDCEMAVVGGSNVMLRPEYPMGMCKGHFLSQDGECKSFDERGDGYGRGEGAAAIVLKPLEAALANNDPVFATVLATGSNQDGHTPGISMPSGEAQKELIEQVCEKYGIDPATIDYVECHGTGTAIGDPIEAGAIGAVYGKRRHSKRGVVIGSIKSNIGHLEAAAGVAGVIKATLTAYHRETNPLANLQKPNPAIPFRELGVELSDRPIMLGDSDRPVRVAVNSFGYGGTNAHAILESIGSHPRRRLNGFHAQKDRRAELGMGCLLPVSARCEKGLADNARRMAEALTQSPCLEDFLYTACQRRAHLSHRAVVQGQSREELIAELEKLSTGEASESIPKGIQPFQGKRRPVFVFTGMGPQWWGMGQELYRTNTIYRNAVEEADAVFAEISGFSILKEMLKGESESKIYQTQLAQPANFVIQIGIATMLMTGGVTPGAVVGHSVGELASAYFSGSLSLRDAMTVCFYRSQLQARCAGTGSMLAMGLSRSQAEEIIAKGFDRISIAAINGKTNLTLAGDSDQLSDIARQLFDSGIFHKKLEVEVPYHSPMMDPILIELKTALASIVAKVPHTPIYSTVTGQSTDAASYGADYWPQNVRQPVLFAAAIESILDDGFNTFIEIGPHPVLATSIRECILTGGKECRQLYTLRRNYPELKNIHQAILRAHTEGCDIDWERLSPKGQVIRLPNYAWQRERYWLENDRAIQDRIAPIHHPMLGIQEAPGTPVWRNDFDHEPMAYLRDHVVTGMPVLPAAAYVESLLELAELQFPEHPGLAIRDFQIRAPMLILPDRGLDAVTSYEPFSHLATIRGLENGKLGTGQIHILAKLAGSKTKQSSQRSLDEMLGTHTKLHNIDSFYQSLDRMGLSYGPAFQCITELRVNDLGDSVMSKLELQTPGAWNADLYKLHPTLLDACFQSLMALSLDSDNMYLPTSFRELTLYNTKAPTTLWCVGRKASESSRTIDCDLTLLDADGNVVATIRSMRSTVASKRERVDKFGDRIKRQILEMQWSYGDNLEEPKRLGHWLMIGSNSPLDSEIARRLEYYGATVSALVQFGEEYREENGRFVVRSGEEEDAIRVIEGCGEVNGIVFLNSTNACANPTDPIGEKAFREISTFAKVLQRDERVEQPRVYVVTQGAFAIMDFDHHVEPSQTALNGFVRVAFNEMDGFQFSTLDLPTQLQEETYDLAALELLCDSSYDEVAIRGSLRFVSELMESRATLDDRIEYQHLNDACPVQIRALRSDCESIGTARVLATSLPPTGRNQVRLRVLSSVVPSSLLLDPTGDSIDQPIVECIVEVMECGSEVDDLTPGQTLIGFIPSDIASQVLVDRKSLIAVPIEHEFLGADTLSTIGSLTRAEFLVHGLKIDTHTKALLESTPLSHRIAEAISRRGGSVAWIVRPDSDAIHPTTDAARFIRSSEGIWTAKQSCAPDHGFDLIGAELHDWMREFDLDILANGGAVLDLDEIAQPTPLPAHCDSLRRVDRKCMLGRTDRLLSALRQAVEFISNKAVAPDPSLEISISDIAWQKLPLADSRATLVMDFDTKGSDLPIVQLDNLSLSREGTYLITGGFGGFGRKTAEWLVARGVRSLVLCGRTGADSTDRIEFVESLRQKGVQVLAAACDTSDRGQLAGLLQEIALSMPPLVGVIHSAALIQDQPIAELDDTTIANVLRSKALGAWNLHLLTQSIRLEHFIVYSSIANLVGNSRQSAYSAANGFINGLAELRRLQGLPATSVAWGAIADVGVVAQDDKLEQFLRYTGLRGIESSEGLELMATALVRNVSQLGITMITSWADWARFETRGSKSPRFATLIASDAEEKDCSIRDALISELSMLDDAERVELLGGLLIEVIASVVKSDPQSIALDCPINQLGVDSLMATEIQLLLDTKLGLSISVLELIGETTIRGLATQSLKTLMGVSSSPDLKPAASKT